MNKPTIGICVDGSAVPNPGNVQWRGIDLQSGNQIFCSKQMPLASNNIAEFLAIVHALALTPNSGIPVYSDSQTARAWAKRMYCSYESIKTAEVVEIVQRAEHWLIEHMNEVVRVQKWETKIWGENPADFGRK